MITIPDVGFQVLGMGLSLVQGIGHVITVLGFRILRSRALGFGASGCDLECRA